MRQIQTNVSLVDDESCFGGLAANTNDTTGVIAARKKQKANVMSTCKSERVPDCDMQKEGEQ
jgi:hypothetical protein